MIKLHTLPTIALAVFLLTNTTNAAKPKPAAGDYFPLRVGDSWNYRHTSGESEYSLKVLSEEKQPDGSSRYEVELLSGVKIISWFSKPSGWVLLHWQRYPEHEGLEAKYEPPKQYLQNPLVAGTKWEWQGKDHTQTEFIEKNQVVGFENVTVPAGKFRAMKVVTGVSGGARMTKTYWYAEGVGLVKSMTDGGQIKYGFELVDYSFQHKAPK
jgi:hypothetical protein